MIVLVVKMGMVSAQELLQTHVLNVLSINIQMHCQNVFIVIYHVKHAMI